jgi:hypothetical protein
MKIKRRLVLVIALSAAILGGYWFQTTYATLPIPFTLPERGVPDPVTFTSLAFSPGTPPTSTAAEGSLNRPPTTTFRSTGGYLREDHYTYLLQIIEPARAGDPESMFEAWQALRLCERHEREFSGHTLTEAIRELPAPHDYQIRKVTEIYAACGRFYAEGFQEFADIVDFKSDAARAGYPPAVIDQELGRLASGLAADEETRARVFGALNSGHPQALVLARNLSLINVVDQTTGRALAIAGCQLGYDCTRQGPLMKEICWTTPLCGESDSFVSFLRRSLRTSEFRTAMETASRVRDEVANGRLDATRLRWDALDNSRFRAKPEQRTHRAIPR